MSTKPSGRRTVDRGQIRDRTGTERVQNVAQDQTHAFCQHSTRITLTFPACEMSLSRLVPALVLSVCCCWMLVFAADDPATKPVTPSSAPVVPGTDVRPAWNSSSSSSSPGNSTDGVKRRGGGMGLGAFRVDGPMIQRALYVLIGITLTGMLYFLIRAVRLKKPAPKKKYGLLSNYDDSVEMEGVESEEDDNTLYEARSLHR